MEHGKKKKMMYGGMAKKKMYGGGMTKKKKMKEGGMAKKKMMKPVDKEKNPGLAKLPTEVRNKMGFMKKGGDVKKAVTEGMKKAGKAAMKAGELGAAIAKVKKKQGMKKGGMTKKKMMGGGMTIKKMKHGGKAGKCPRDGIAMKGKTRAGR